MRLIISLIIFLPLIAFSQEKATFSLKFNDVPVSEALQIIEETYKVHKKEWN